MELISLFFTLWLSVFLFAYLDWKELFHCTDEETCHDSLSDYIIDKVSQWGRGGFICWYYSFFDAAFEGGLYLSVLYLIITMAVVAYCMMYLLQYYLSIFFTFIPIWHKPLSATWINIYSTQTFQKLALYNFLILSYIILFSAYGIFAINSFYNSVKDALEAKFIFEDKLGISARKLEGGTVEWHQVIQKILELQQSGEYRVAIHGQDIKDELVITQRIMRKENFMIAFFNLNLLDLTIPLPWRSGVNGRSKTKFYSRSLEVRFLSLIL